jgi:hypothetical protein
MARQAEAAAHLEAQQIPGHPTGEAVLQLAIKAIEITIAAEAHREVVPLDPASGLRCHGGWCVSLQVHQQHLAALVAVALIKAIRFRRAGVPGLG